MGKRKIGKLATNHKNGDFYKNKKYYCKDCKKKITNITAINGKGRCPSCGVECECVTCDKAPCKCNDK